MIISYLNSSKSEKQEIFLNQLNMSNLIFTLYEECNYFININ